MFGQSSVASARNKFAKLIGSDLVGDGSDSESDVSVNCKARSHSRGLSLGKRQRSLNQRMKAATATELQGLPQLDTPDCGHLFRDLCFHNDV